MTSFPFTLERDESPTAGDMCSKCAKLRAEGEKQRPPKRVVTHTAKYSLRQGPALWRLCPNHAAESARTLAIKHASFNPEGKSLVNSKE